MFTQQTHEHVQKHARTLSAKNFSLQISIPTKDNKKLCSPFLLHSTESHSFFFPDEIFQNKKHTLFLQFYNIFIQKMTKSNSKQIALFMFYGIHLIGDIVSSHNIIINGNKRLFCKEIQIHSRFGQKHTSAALLISCAAIYKNHQQTVKIQKKFCMLVFSVYLRFALHFFNKFHFFLSTIECAQSWQWLND